MARKAKLIHKTDGTLSIRNVSLHEDVYRKLRAATNRFDISILSERLAPCFRSLCEDAYRISRLRNAALIVSYHSCQLSFADASVEREECLIFPEIENTKRKVDKGSPCYFSLILEYHRIELLNRLSLLESLYEIYQMVDRVPTSVSADRKLLIRRKRWPFASPHSIDRRLAVFKKPNVAKLKELALLKKIPSVEDAGFETTRLEGLYRVDPIIFDTDHRYSASWVVGDLM